MADSGKGAADIAMMAMIKLVAFSEYAQFVHEFFKWQDIMG